MSRIRSIHPGIYTDEAFMSLTVERPLAIPLLFGLWAEADDAGTFEWKPLTIKARILPAASVTIEELLCALVEHQFIKLFEVAGKSYGVVRNFAKFQRPKEPREVFPATDEMRAYAGFTSEGTRPNPPRGRKKVESISEVLPNDFRNPSEIRSQMEDGGGRMKENTPVGEQAPALKLVEPPTPEAELYRRGKQVLGQSAGGMIKKLVAAKGGSIAQARAAIETASEKGDPGEYIGAIIRGREDDGRSLRERGYAW
jgi:hypothetical protein